MSAAQQPDRHVDEQEILARAQREVAARREAAATRHMRGGRSWWPVGCVLLVLIAFIAAPEPMPRKLLLAMGGVCSLRPTHSYFSGGLQLPLESRMMGIYGSLLLTLLWLVGRRRFRARRLGSPSMVGLLLAFFASMVLDGLNSTLAELGWRHLYTPTNPLRLLSGLLAGIALAPALVWLVSVIALPRDELRPEAVVRSPRDLLWPLALGAGFAALTLDGRDLWYYPLALITVGGVVVALATAAFLLVLSMGRVEGRIGGWRQARGPVALALLIAFAVLAATAALRWIGGWAPLNV